jgi:hypothetical protein
VSKRRRDEEIRQVTAELAARLEELRAAVEALTAGLTGSGEQQQVKEEGEPLES